MLTLVIKFFTLKLPACLVNLSLKIWSTQAKRVLNRNAMYSKFWCTHFPQKYKAPVDSEPQAGMQSRLVSGKASPVFSSPRTSYFRSIPLFFLCPLSRRRFSLMGSPQFSSKFSSLNSLIQYSISELRHFTGGLGNKGAEVQFSSMYFILSEIHKENRTQGISWNLDIFTKDLTDRCLFYVGVSWKVKIPFFPTPLNCTYFSNYGLCKDD